MDDKPIQCLEHLLHGKHISGEVRESVFEKAWGLVQRGLGTVAVLKAQGWGVLQSTGEAEACPPRGTMMTTEEKKIRAVVSARDKVKALIGPVPRPLKNDTRPAREWDPSSWQTKGSRTMLLPVFACERDIFPHPCCPNVKGCRRTQQVNGRRRLTTEFANGAVNSLNWLAGHKNSSLTPRMHVGCMDVKHSALWRYLFDFGRQIDRRNQKLCTTLLCEI